MPRYFFDKTDHGAEARDAEGRELSTEEEARAHTVRLVRKSLQKPDRVVEDGSAIAVDARDDAGNHICTARLAFSDRTE